MAEEEIKSFIKNELNYLGYNPNYCGTRYIMEAIYILYKNSENLDFDCNLKKNVYPIIAKHYGRNVLNIKCNIVNATDNMICECEEEKLLSYLGYYSFAKPGPKKIIESILNKLLKKSSGINRFNIAV